jgi:acyl-CoA reductase-like NAD-dependent aldehyde dehydrogenase
MEVQRSIESQIIALKSAQRLWTETSFKSRQKMARHFSAVIAENGRLLHDTIRTPQRRGYRETISSELLPLAAAACWLSRELDKILKPRYVASRRTPMWLGRLRSEVRREPFGVILIIGTWNYPIFLVGVQMLHAIMAGNAVLVKPAADCEAVTHRLRELFVEAGVPQELIGVLDSSVESAQEALQTGIDKVILTGSTKSGQAVLRSMAESLTPGVMELSGCDAMFLLADFDEKRVVDALVFSLRLNGGATCLAPRRVFVPRGRLDKLEQRLAKCASAIEPTTLSQSTMATLESRLTESLGQSMVPLDIGVDSSSKTPIGAATKGYPVILSPVSPNAAIAKTDIFAPLVSLIPYDHLEDAVRMNGECPYALTVSIFGNPTEAAKLAPQLKAGSVTINDIIVPTADPRLPFGGVGQSGFGVTRGVEGLLEMTYPKVISNQLGKTLRHLEAPAPRDELVLEGLLQWSHASTIKRRLQGLRKMVDAVRGVLRSQD